MTRDYIKILKKTNTEYTIITMFNFIKNTLSSLFTKKVDAQTLQELEKILIEADFGVPTTKKIIDQLIRERQVEIVDWEEDTTAKNLTISKNKNVIIKEFKLKENIFKLAESLYPGNLKCFIYLLNQLSDNISEYLIFTIIIKQIRNLILIKLNQLDKKLASWQIYKLKFQVMSKVFDDGQGKFGTFHLFGSFHLASKIISDNLA